MNTKPGFYYGFVIVVASAFVMLTGWGVYYGYGVFFEPLLNEFGWTRAVASGAYSLSALISGATGILAGRVSDRLGPKKVTAFCGVIFGVGFILMSRINSAWQLYLLYALPISLGVGGLWSPMVSTVARWFVQKRGLMTGIVGSGIGLGALIFPPVISTLITAHGWRIAYIIIGATVIVVILIAAQFLKRDPGQIGALSYGEKGSKALYLTAKRDFSFRQAMRTRPFWMIASVYFLFGYVQVTLSVHIVPYASGLGIAPITAASVLALIGGVSILGRILIGSISDRVHVRPSLIFVLILMFLSIIWLNFAGVLWALYLFAAIFGFAWGGLSALQSLVSADAFGLRSLGALVGGFSFSFCLGGMIGPVVAGHIYDVDGSYKLAFMILTIVAFMAVMAVIWLSPARKGNG